LTLWKDWLGKCRGRRGVSAVILLESIIASCKVEEKAVAVCTIAVV
jgi:hypothetical protein